MWSLLGSMRLAGGLLWAATFWIPYSMCGGDWKKTVSFGMLVLLVSVSIIWYYGTTDVRWTHSLITVVPLIGIALSENV